MGLEVTRSYQVIGMWGVCVQLFGYLLKVETTCPGLFYLLLDWKADVELNQPQSS